MDFWQELRQVTFNRVQGAVNQIFPHANKVLTSPDKALDLYTVDLGEPVVLSFHYKPKEMTANLTGFSNRATKNIAYDDLGRDGIFGLIKELLDKYEHS